MSILYCVNFKADVGSAESGTFQQFTDRIVSWATGPGSQIERKLVKSGNQTAWGLKKVHNDGTKAKVQWTSEFLLHQTEVDQLWTFSCRVHASHELGITDIPLRVRPPKVIETLVKSTGCFDRQGVLTITPWCVQHKSLQRFIKWLDYPKRSRPVVFLTATHDQQPSLMCSPYTLAAELVGLADVWFTKDPNVTRKDALRFIEPKYEDGGAQLFWPADEHGDSNFGPAWSWLEIAEMAAAKNFGGEVAKQIHICAGAGVKDELDWGTMIQLIYAENERSNARKTSEEFEALAKMVDEERDEQRKKVGDLDATIQQLKEENKTLRKKVFLQHSAVQSTEEKENDTDGANSNTFADGEVTSVKEALDRAQAEWPEKLIVHLNGKSDKDSDFERPKEVFLALKWLVEELHPAFMGEKRLSSATPGSYKLDGALSRWKYAPNTGNPIIDRYSEFYHCRYDGMEFRLDAHLKGGNGRDSRDGIRIGLAWHPKDKKILIGYLGQHPKNLNS